MSRLCRKCQQPIPNRLVINGYQHILSSRKFCLTCSPFKGNNRSSTEPFAIKPKKAYAVYTDEEKDKIKKSLYQRAYERKLELVKKLGGCCKKCGYKKYLRVLTFHHRNPLDKLFGLSLNNLWSKTPQEIHKEAEKCDLLCMNCHAELEEDISNSKCSQRLIQVKQSLNLIGAPVG